MSRKCQITGKTVATGNNVAHSGVKTRRRFLPNLHMISFLSEILGEKIRLRVSRQAIRTIEFKGGIDNYLLNARAAKLTDDAKKIKKRIVKCQAKKEAATAK